MAGDHRDLRPSDPAELETLWGWARLSGQGRSLLLDALERDRPLHEELEFLLRRSPRLISLELGGAPSDPRNLFPEPHAPEPGARQKDTVENRLNDEVCSARGCSSTTSTPCCCATVSYTMLRKASRSG
jgi:hypothetical protein